jgi:mycothiol synthase
VNEPRAALSWRALGQPDLAAITDLARLCLSADGGQPFAADPGFLSGWYASGAATHAGWDGQRLVCVSSLRQQPRSGDSHVTVTTGMVHPAWRRRGIGGHAFDWAARTAGDRELHAETEALGDGAHALYLSKGLTQVFAEDVMQLPASARPPGAHAPDGLILSPWGQADPVRFYSVYEAAFRDRPGFPGWQQARWIEWISADDDFRPEWALLATLAGTDVGFVVGDASGWIIQMGVVPSARGKNIGAWLIGEAVRRMRSAGETAITLNVNMNNPHAAMLYLRLGFTTIGRRARYRG